jgi:hypothetical protein
LRSSLHCRRNKDSIEPFHIWLEAAAGEGFLNNEQSI